MSYRIERIETDVVIIGGGIAGTLAAIHAEENGAKAVLVERANTNRSGSAGSGIDHLFSYVPPVHEKVGYTKEMMKADMALQDGSPQGLADAEIADHFVEVSFERILSLEKYGLKLRFEGGHLADGFRLVPQFHSIPTSINFEGRDLKVRLTAAAERAGARILNHAAGVRVLTDGEGRAAGAVAISSREDVIYDIRAKAVVITTSGGARRLSQKVNRRDRYYENPSSSGLGSNITLALDAGAEVANLEFSLHTGELAFRGFSTRVGSPGSSWWPAAQAVDDDGEVVCARINDYSIDEPDYLEKNAREYAAFMDEFYSIHRNLAKGRQLYMDFSAATDAELDYIRWTLGHEGRMWLYLQNLKRNGIDLKDVQVPYVLDQSIKVGARGGGPIINSRTETTVPGLYAAGDAAGVTGGSGGFAVVFGIEAGIQAAAYARGLAALPEADGGPAAETLAAAEALRANAGGEPWQNVENHLQAVVETFGAAPFTDTRVRHALELIGDLKASPNLRAADPHEAARCFEVLSLIEASEAIFRAVEHRDESFGDYLRIHRYKDLEAELRREKPETTVVYGLYRDRDGRYGFRTHDYRKSAAGGAEGTKP